jgi:hypothetical protein
MARAELEPTIPVFERLKTVRVLDRTAIGTGSAVKLKPQLGRFRNFFLEEMDMQLISHITEPDNHFMP